MGLSLANVEKRFFDSGLDRFEKSFESGFYTVGVFAISVEDNDSIVLV